MQFSNESADPPSNLQRQCSIAAARELLLLPAIKITVRPRFNEHPFRHKNVRVVVNNQQVKVKSLNKGSLDRVRTVHS